MRISGILTVFLLLAQTAAAAQGNSLRTLYKKKKFRFNEQLRIDINSAPNDVAFSDIGQFAFTDDGNIFIIDINQHNIKVFSSEGKFVKVVGQAGAGPGDLNLPSTITCNGKYIIVWEIRNRRFSLFNQDGTFVRSVKPEIKGRPLIWKMRSMENGVTILENEKSKFGDNSGQECILFAYNQEMELIKQIYSQHILRNKYVFKPVSSNIIQPFQPLVSWDLLSEGRIIIGFQKEYRIEIFDLNGKTAEFSHPWEPTKVTEKDKREFFNGLTYSIDNQKIKTPDYVIENTSFPRYKPAFKQIITDREGHILVLVNNGEDEGIMTLDVFDSDGRFINRVKAEAGTTNFLKMYFSPDGHLWTTITDEEDESALVKFKIE